MRIFFWGIFLQLLFQTDDKFLKEKSTLQNSGTNWKLAAIATSIVVIVFFSSIIIAFIFHLNISHKIANRGYLQNRLTGRLRKASFEKTRKASNSLISKDLAGGRFYAPSLEIGHQVEDNLGARELKVSRFLASSLEISHNVKNSNSEELTGTVQDF
ncbi:hypothetical protein PoB_001239000 [Plakobranchus ocellatus]|uniref:Uncharacterized protein n=1 Tax=Plakobranchus ocellatus TaxID=259542 RepID=A0AAV3YTX5_9GAST|nr:hypothetical protein PoB_001239000 [Plakobranchus ocellatus]